MSKLNKGYYIAYCSVTLLKHFIYEVMLHCTPTAHNSPLYQQFNFLDKRLQFIRSLTGYLLP